MSEFKPGSFGCHEALHMTSFLTSAIDSELAEHPTIKDNPRWLQMAEMARDVLASLYQEIGAVHIDPPTSGLHTKAGRARP